MYKYLFLIGLIIFIIYFCFWLYYKNSFNQKYLLKNNFSKAIICRDNYYGGNYKIENFQASTNYTANQVINFEYAGSVSTFQKGNATKIRIEVWGAQGGGGKGGRGGYSKGDYVINENLYVVVGKRGDSSDYSYNGGGRGKRDEGSGAQGPSGGGATHVAKKTGLLKDLVNDKGSVIIVAGGGGGGGSNNYSSGYDKDGGAGGGENGGNGNSGGGGGSQTGVGYSGSSERRDPGGFGYGGTGPNTYADGGFRSGGGGGGWYGGGAGSSDSNGGGGGSGFIGNTQFPTQLTGEVSTSAGIRDGNGFARITILDVVSEATLKCTATTTNPPACPQGTRACSYDASLCFDNSNNVFTTKFNPAQDKCPENNSGGSRIPQDISGVRVWPREKIYDLTDYKDVGKCSAICGGGQIKQIRRVINLKTNLEEESARCPQLTAGSRMYPCNTRPCPEILLPPEPKLKGIATKYDSVGTGASSSGLKYGGNCLNDSDSCFAEYRIAFKVGNLVGKGSSMTIKSISPEGLTNPEILFVFENENDIPNNSFAVLQARTLKPDMQSPGDKKLFKYCSKDVGDWRVGENVGVGEQGKDAENCRSSCVSNSNCTAYLHNNNNLCWLMKNSSVSSKNVTGYTSGSCRDLSQVNIWYDVEVPPINLFTNPKSIKFTGNTSRFGPGVSEPVMDLINERKSIKKITKKDNVNCAQGKITNLNATITSDYKNLGTTNSYQDCENKAFKDNDFDKFKAINWDSRDNPLKNRCYGIFNNLTNVPENGVTCGAIGFLPTTIITDKIILPSERSNFTEIEKEGIQSIYEFLSNVMNLTNKSFINLSVGNGRSLYYATNYFTNAKGIDNSQPRIDEAKFYYDKFPQDVKDKIKIEQKLFTTLTSSYFDGASAIYLNNINWPASYSDQLMGILSNSAPSDAYVFLTRIPEKTFRYNLVQKIIAPMNFDEELELYIFKKK